MSLTEKDLQDIKGVVKEIVDDSIEKNNDILSDKILSEVRDIVDFAIEQSEQRTDGKFDKIDKKLDKLEDGLAEVKEDLVGFRAEMNREISDIAENNREFLGKLGDHEIRITKLETKGVAIK